MPEAHTSKVFQNFDITELLHAYYFDLNSPANEFMRKRIILHKPQVLLKLETIAGAVNACIRALARDIDPDIDPPFPVPDELQIPGEAVAPNDIEAILTTALQGRGIRASEASTPSERLHAISHALSRLSFTDTRDRANEAMRICYDRSYSGDLAHAGQRFIRSLCRVSIPLSLDTFPMADAVLERHLAQDRPAEPSLSHQETCAVIDRIYKLVTGDGPVECPVVDSHEPLAKLSQITLARGPDAHAKSGTEDYKGRRRMYLRVAARDAAATGNEGTDGDAVK